MRPLTRQSRHPVMVSEMACVGTISVWQILAGEARHETLWHLPANTYVLLALVSIFGCIFCVTATVMADAWTAAAFELAGALMLVGTLAVNLYAITSSAPYPDTDIVTGLTAGLMLGLLVRVIYITLEVISVVKDRQAPPVGDLDLDTADTAGSVAELIAATHGGPPIEREAAAVVGTLPRTARHAR